MIASHGGDGRSSRSDFVDSVNEKGLFLTSNLILIEFNKILNYFISVNFPSLANKPKIFIFDCCRGSRRVRGINDTSQHHTNLSVKESSTPSYSDCIVISSTTSGECVHGSTII